MKQTVDSGGFRGGCNRRTPPPKKKKKKKKIDRLFSFIPYCIRMLINKPQIAQESIKKTRASRALKQALDPGCKGLRASFAPPPPQ